MGTHPIFESDFDCLTELEMSNNRKLLVASVLKFLQAEIESKKITPDQEESLNVASQCLAMAFNTTPEDAKDLPDLLELLSNACPDKMGKTEVSEEQKELAQKFKNEGNALVKEQKYKEAIEKYTEAIKCQESAIFYCNRAAAYTSLTNYEEALQDCKKAISFDPDYSKAYSRMSLIYSKINLYNESENCYEKALGLEPENESYKKNLEIVKEKLKERQAAAPAGFPGMPGGMPGGMPDMGGMAGGMPGMPGAEEAQAGAAAAGMPDFASAMAGMNPQAMQAGMAMAQQMMQENPEQVEEMRRMMGGMMGGAPPGPQ